jgi:hypothetical protein
VIPSADHAKPLYPQKLALASPTSGGRSVGVVRSRTKATELVICRYFQSWQCDIFSRDGASHMNARATSSNGETVKGNGGVTVFARAVEDNFAVILEI